MVKKFLKNTTMTSTKKSVAFTPQIPSKLGIKLSGAQPQGVSMQGKTIRLNNRAVPLNPNAPVNKPRSGNFGTKRLVGF